MRGKEEKEMVMGGKGERMGWDDGGGGGDGDGKAGGGSNRG